MNLFTEKITGSSNWVVWCAPLLRVNIIARDTQLSVISC